MDSLTNQQKTLLVENGGKAMTEIIKVCPTNPFFTFDPPLFSQALQIKLGADPRGENSNENCSVCRKPAREKNHPCVCVAFGMQTKRHSAFAKTTQLAALTAIHQDHIGREISLKEFIENKNQWIEDRNIDASDSESIESFNTSQTENTQSKKKSKQKICSQTNRK